MGTEGVKCLFSILTNPLVGCIGNVGRGLVPWGEGLCEVLVTSAKHLKESPSPLPSLAQTQVWFSKSAETWGRRVWTSLRLHATHPMEHTVQTSPKLALNTPQYKAVSSFTQLRDQSGSCILIAGDRIEPLANLAPHLEM